MHYVTNRKVAGTIPDEITESSIDLILPAALWPWYVFRPTEMNIRNHPKVKVRLARKVFNLTAICKPIVQKMWKPRRLTTFYLSVDGESS
jgi:hypothetical protein